MRGTYDAKHVLCPGLWPRIHCYHEDLFLFCLLNDRYLRYELSVPFCGKKHDFRLSYKYIRVCVKHVAANDILPAHECLDKGVLVSV